jgi:hypothetical protein
MFVLTVSVDGLLGFVPPTVARVYARTAGNREQVTGYSQLAVPCPL